MILVPKVKAFIHFVDSVENCRFRSDVQANPWTTEDFPHDEIFKTVDQFKQYFEERKKELSSCSYTIRMERTGQRS